MPDLGDTATATLTVDPFDGTTSATLALAAPDGTETAPSTSTADSGATWTATVVYDQVGWWLLTWTVTGTGAGIEHQRVFVPEDPASGTEPAYAKLELLKGALKITSADRDDLLIAALIAASRSIDDICGRRFYLDGTAIARKFAPERRAVATEHGQRLVVPDIGSETGLVVEVGRDGAWTDITSRVELHPLNALAQDEPVTSLLFEDSSFTAYRRARVTARWGWPVVPDVVNQATLIQAQRLYKRKDSPEGVLGSAEWGTVRVGRIDPDVQALVSHLMVPGF